MRRHNMLVLLAIGISVLPVAFSIKCYECQTDMESLGKVNVTKNMTQEDVQKIVDSMPLCQNPTKVLECPSNMGSCMDTRLGMSFKIPVVNVTINVTAHTMNCTSDMRCSAAAKKMICDSTKKNSKGSGPAIEECDIDCCETDLCDEVVTPTAAPTTAGPQVTSVAMAIPKPTNSAEPNNTVTTTTMSSVNETQNIHTTHVTSTGSMIRRGHAGALSTVVLMMALFRVPC